MEQKCWAGIPSGWLAAGCALALWLCLPLLANAQDASGAGSPQQGSGTTKTASLKKAATPAGKGTAANTNSPARKAHAVSHPPPGKHGKSNATVAAHSGNHPGLRKTSRKKTARGQQKIEPERAQAIQEALIREHYLSGNAAASWNQSSEDAMRKYQADHGWQSKTVPDSRALISLGLGPSHDRLLNPDSAMTTGPEGPHPASLTSTSPNPISHGADPGAVQNVNRRPPATSQPAPPADHTSTDPQ